MALPPKLVGQKLLAATADESKHTLELYLDYVCPFSARLFNTFYTSVRPVVTQRYHSKLQVIFRQHIQPWHPSSTLVHEAGAAVLRVAPEKFWDFSAALFKQQAEFFDARVVNEGRNKTYERLAKIAGQTGVNESQVFELLKINENPQDESQIHVGNGVTSDVKRMVKVSCIRLQSACLTV